MSFNRDTALTRIQKVFAEVFKLAPADVTIETSLANTQEWDSLQHMQLVMALETEFQIQFEMAEIIDLQSVAQILDSLASKRLAS